MGLRQWLLVALCASVWMPACDSGRQRVPFDGGAEEAVVDPEAARQTVVAFIAAVETGNKDEIRRRFSFGALASAFQPKSVLRVSPKLMSAFVEEVVEQMVDPKSALHRLVAGATVGAAAHKHEQGKESAVVEAMSRGAPIRFQVIARAGRLQVSRIE